MTKALLRAGFVAVLLGLVVVQWRTESERRALERLRVATSEARVEARACRQRLAIGEAEFQMLTARVDSLRAAIDALEALDDRGVPADRYEEYLATVEAFNAGVAQWDRDADRLRTAEGSCRETVADYNRLADSARTMAVGQSPGT